MAGRPAVCSMKLRLKTIASVSEWVSRNCGGSCCTTQICVSSFCRSRQACSLPACSVVFTWKWYDFYAQVAMFRFFSFALCSPAVKGAANVCSTLQNWFFFSAWPQKEIIKKRSRTSLEHEIVSSFYSFAFTFCLASRSDSPAGGCFCKIYHWCVLSCFTALLPLKVWEWLWQECLTWPSDVSSDVTRDAFFLWFSFKSKVEKHQRILFPSDYLASASFSRQSQYEASCHNNLRGNSNDSHHFWEFI